MKRMKLPYSASPDTSETIKQVAEILTAKQDSVKCTLEFTLRNGWTAEEYQGSKIFKNHKDRLRVIYVPPKGIQPAPHKWYATTAFTLYTTTHNRVCDGQQQGFKMSFLLKEPLKGVAVLGPDGNEFLEYPPTADLETYEANLESAKRFLYLEYPDWRNPLAYWDIELPLKGSKAMPKVIPPPNKTSNEGYINVYRQ